MSTVKCFEDLKTWQMGREVLLIMTISPKMNSISSKTR